MNNAHVIVENISGTGYALLIREYRKLKIPTIHANILMAYSMRSLYVAKDPTNISIEYSKMLTYIAAISCCPHTLTITIEAYHPVKIIASKRCLTNWLHYSIYHSIINVHAI